MNPVKIIDMRIESHHKIYGAKYHGILHGYDFALRIKIHNDHHKPLKKCIFDMVFMDGETQLGFLIDGGEPLNPILRVNTSLFPYETKEFSFPRLRLPSSPHLVEYNKSRIPRGLQENDQFVLMDTVRSRTFRTRNANEVKAEYNKKILSITTLIIAAITLGVVIFKL